MTRIADTSTDYGLYYLLVILKMRTKPAAKKAETVPRDRPYSACNMRLTLYNNNALLAAYYVSM